MCGVNVGTPWSVVWTSDERQFFFDATSRVSLWIMPEELKENPHVDRIIEGGPESSSKWSYSKILFVNMNTEILA